MISLTCTDTLDYASAIRAIKNTMSCIPISKVYWVSDIELTTNEFSVTWVKIKKIKKFPNDYNFITLKLIPHIVVEPYNIIVQSDGFAVNKNSWDNEFLKYDYIGARWNNGIVGNGGFCLRSRKLYDALLDLEVIYRTEDYSKEIINNYENYVFDSKGNKVIPEDNIICKIYRRELEEKYDIKFADGNIADKFSIEHNMSSPWLGKSLGFHGKHGIAKHYGVEL